MYLQSVDEAGSRSKDGSRSKGPWFRLMSGLKDPYTPPTPTPFPPTTELGQTSLYKGMGLLKINVDRFELPPPFELDLKVLIEHSPAVLHYTPAQNGQASKLPAAVGKLCN